MTDDRSESQDPQSLLGALLTPLRAPQRVITDIETIASALISLQRDARDRLRSIDEHAGKLVGAVGALQAPVENLDRGVVDVRELVEILGQRIDTLQLSLTGLDDKVAELSTMEQAITERMDTVDVDLNTRMLAVEAEVRSIRSPIEQMTRDLAHAVKLLPQPGDGPLTRLKDTFSPS